jgi:penicillin-binding protein 1A
VYIKPITYTKVEDNQGKTLLVKKPESNAAFKPTTAYLTNQLLKGVVTSGTAAGSTIPGMDTAGKTGTTDDDADRWFAGYTPYYSAVVWVGYDSLKTVPAFGANPALTLWKKVMVKIHQGLSSKYFDRPAGLTGVEVCSETGLLYTESCIDEEGNSTAATRYFISGTEPTEECPGHDTVAPEENPDGEGENTGEEEEDPEYEIPPEFSTDAEEPSEEETNE